MTRTLAKVFLSTRGEGDRIDHSNRIAQKEQLSTSEVASLFGMPEGSCVSKEDFRWMAASQRYATWTQIQRPSEIRTRLTIQRARPPSLGPQHPEHGVNSPSHRPFNSPSSTGRARSESRACLSPKLCASTISSPVPQSRSSRLAILLFSPLASDLASHQIRDPARSCRSAASAVSSGLVLNARRASGACSRIAFISRSKC